MSSPFDSKVFFPSVRRHPASLLLSHCLGVNLMRNLTMFCLFRPWANGEGSPGFRLPVCVCDFELTSERTQAVDKLSVFREAAWRLGLFNGCQSEFRVTTCQSGLTSPAGKLRGKKKNMLCLELFFFGFFENQPSCAVGFNNIDVWANSEAYMSNYSCLNLATSHFFVQGE